MQTIKCSSRVFIIQNHPVPGGPTPPNLIDKQLSFLPGVIFDRAPIGSYFGKVTEDAKAQYIQVNFLWN